MLFVCSLCEDEMLRKIPRPVRYVMLRKIPRPDVLSPPLCLLTSTNDQPPAAAAAPTCIVARSFEKLRGPENENKNMCCSTCRGTHEGEHDHFLNNDRGAALIIGGVLTGPTPPPTVTEVEAFSMLQKHPHTHNGTTTPRPLVSQTLHTNNAATTKQYPPLSFRTLRSSCSSL